MEYLINRGIGRPAEFKGLKSQYLFIFAGGLLGIFIAFVVMYMIGLNQSMKFDGYDLQYVPEKFRTPEVCLQAVMSIPEAKAFVPERFPGNYNIYEFYHGKLRDDFITYKQFTFDQVQKIFNGETVNVTGMKWFNVTLKDFS